MTVLCWAHVDLEVWPASMECSWVTWSCCELGHELGDATRSSVKEEAVRFDPWTRGDELLANGTVGGFRDLPDVGLAGWRRAAGGIRRRGTCERGRGCGRRDLADCDLI
jgi:hypothetical protein